ncbi:hypothetical protein AUJ35_01690 [Candidatus Falkowbacteria bacterium CG1_02_41_21]|uniref:Glycosyltransferase RgtA/B/C/D-like domain-containing protein n=2 Tax=Candidatus Falkowiibacteriota TaxID=1752728 RepID=A0A1J4T766_9BACT|nr:MAG: hypothetical protein AUJ35_01690 [Candidatus Falkowbacteria bacterium CG1_02_41_21]
MFKNNKKIIWQTLLWLIILGWCFFAHADHSFDSDEGVILDGAWNLYNDRHLYSDFFEFITPGSFYLIFFIWKIFGISFWSAKIASILLLFLSAIGIYSIAQKISKNKLNILAPIFFCLATSGLPLINHNFYSLPFAIWAIYFLLLALDNSKAKYFICGGLLTGITILFLQTKGLALGTAIFLFLLGWFKGRLKTILIYLGAALIPLLIFLFWPLQTIINNLLIFPINNYQQINKVSVTSLLISTLILGLIVYLFRREKNPKIWLLLILQFFLLLTTIPLPDYYHLLIAGVPIMALTGIIINQIKNKAESIYSKLANYSIVVITMSFVLYPAIDFLVFNFKPLVSANREVFVFIENNCPGKYIYAGPFAPNVYFESRKLNATPYPWLLTGHNTPEQFLEAKEYLIKNEPSCAILAYPRSQSRFNYNQDNLVENFIRDDYYQIHGEQNFYIYKKN